KLIGKVDANPAIQNNVCYTFLAQDIHSDGQINFDPEEEIEHELVPLEKVRDYIANGKITNTFIIAAFYWLERELGTF
ncbi:MAG: NUDIX hydrolase, partial [Promethearchaeota archaeon]